MAQPDLSIVLPCYGAAETAIESVDRLTAELSSSGERFEIFVVDDGVGDIEQMNWRPPAGVTVLRLAENRGKGAAVRAGMLRASGDIRIFTDVDLPYGVDILHAFIAYIRDRGFHLAIGDRTLPKSTYQQRQSLERRLASRLFTLMTGSFLTGGFYDTQCGLKAFRGDVADELFRLQSVERFAFDVELVYMALIHRLDIKRIPVELEQHGPSSLRLVRDSLSMVRDVVSLKWRRARGQYASPAVERIVEADFERARAEAELARPARPMGEGTSDAP